MNTDHRDDAIPTLTEIIQPGNPSMKNHFDAGFFDTEEPSPAMEAETESELIETIEVLVQDALNESLPALEERLKGEVTRKVLEKLERARDS